MNERSIFAAALDIADPADRAAYLERACAGDADLRRHVEELIASQDDLGSFLGRPPVLLQKTGPFEPMAEGPGSRVGPYKLLQQIGEGGMGVVFMAEQQEPVRRKVALKIIKPGMDSRQVVARFEAERQALSMMDHPNIARVLDGGATENGRPYFVMELVHGVPLTEFCDARKLSLRDRLELFVPVCQAIQHAHQKGIIHRDIKPSNVLVTMYDDKPMPKVIDFGVAKAVEQRLTEKTLFTQFGMMVGTFEYMSPEQAEMNAFGVDTRSDIYSLGVLLYQLLTGTTPLEQSRLREAAYGEIVRLIREEEPPRPSVRLSSSGDLAKVAAARQADPAKLSSLVRGELDWIVMRCLEKDRTRRYDAASGLAKDVQRYLAGDAVEACPPSLGYRLSKFLGKHRASLSVAAAFALLLLVGTAVSVVMAVRATTAERATAIALDATREAHGIAETKRIEVEKLNAYFLAARNDLRRSLYASHMSEAQAAWDAKNTARVLELLEQTRPGPGEDDLRGFEWHYWNRQCNAEKSSIQVTVSGPRRLNQRASPTFGEGSLRLSPDGSRILVGSSGFMRYDANSPAPLVPLWDTQSGKVVTTLPPGSISAGLPYFSGDGKRIVCPVPVSEPEEAVQSAYKVLDTVTGKVITHLPRTGTEATPKPNQGGPGRNFPVIVAVSHDGRHVARVNVLDKGGLGLTIWNADVGRIECVADLADPDFTLPSSSGFRGPSSRQELVFSPNGQELALLTPHKSQVSMGGGANGDEKKPAAEKPKTLGLIRFLDTATGKERHRIKLTGSMQGLAYAPDGQRLLGFGYGNSFLGAEAYHLPVWDTATGKELFGLSWSGPRPSEIVFSPDGKLIAGWADKSTVLHLWDGETGAPRPGLTGHAVPIQAVAFLDDTQVVVALTDGVVKTWDLGGGVPFIPGNANLWFANRGVKAFHPQGPRVLFMESKRERGRETPPDAQWYSLRTPGRPEVPLDLPYSEAGTSPHLSFSPDGRYIAAYRNTRRFEHSFDNTLLLPDGMEWPAPTLKVLDAETGRAVWITTRPRVPGVLAWGAGGKRIALAEYDKSRSGLTVTLFEAATGRELGLTSPIPASFGDSRGLGSGSCLIAFNATGNRVAVVVSDGEASSLNVWDAESRALLRQVIGLPAASLRNSIAFSPDSRLLAWSASPRSRGGNTECEVIVLDVETGQRRLTLDGLGNVAKVEFSPDGQRLLTAERGRIVGGLTTNQQTSVVIWDVVLGRPLLRFKEAASVMDVQFSPNGRQICGVRLDTGGAFLKTWDASPLPPELEGRQRFNVLASQAVTRAELIESIHNDARLDDASRRVALALAEQVVDHPETINTASWTVAKQAGRTPEEYQVALKRAEELIRLEYTRDKANFFNTLGAAQYRRGQYKDALDSLTKADEGHKGERPEDHVLLAMVHHQLGNREEALRFLEMARTPKKDNPNSKRDMPGLLAEADALILGPR